MPPVPCPTHEIVRLQENGDRGKIRLYFRFPISWTAECIYNLPPMVQLCPVFLIFFDVGHLFDDGQYGGYQSCMIQFHSYYGKCMYGRKVAFSGKNNVGRVIKEKPVHKFENTQTKNTMLSTGRYIFIQKRNWFQNVRLSPLGGGGVSFTCNIADSCRL